MNINGTFKPDNKLHEEFFLYVFVPILQKELNELLMTWNNRNARQSAAATGSVTDVLFHMTGTVNFQNQGIGEERRDIDVTEDILGVNSLPFFRNKDLYELFESYVHIHSLIRPKHPKSGIQFYAE